MLNLYSVSLVTLDEYAIRGTLLIAGLHYAWNTGNLVAFQSAFLFHKIESIRIINKWLHADDAQTIALCIRQVCTLILVEVRSSTPRFILCAINSNLDRFVSATFG